MNFSYAGKATKYIFLQSSQVVSLQSDLFQVRKTIKDTYGQTGKSVIIQMDKFQIGKMLK